MIRRFVDHKNLSSPIHLNILIYILNNLVQSVSIQKNRALNSFVLLKSHSLKNTSMSIEYQRVVIVTALVESKIRDQGARVN